MAQAKKTEDKSTGTEGQEYYEGKARPPAEDPSFHIEDWPEAYDKVPPENETAEQRQAREDLAASRDERRQATEEARQAAEQQRQANLQQLSDERQQTQKLQAEQQPAPTKDS